MEDLSSYLNDHLAGSVGALELLDRLIDIYKGNRSNDSLGICATKSMRTRRLLRS